MSNSDESWNAKIQREGFGAGGYAHESDWNVEWNNPVRPDYRPSQPSAQTLSANAPADPQLDMVIAEGNAAVERAGYADAYDWSHDVPGSVDRYHDANILRSAAQAYANKRLMQAEEATALGAPIEFRRRVSG